MRGCRLALLLILLSMTLLLWVAMALSMRISHDRISRAAIYTTPGPPLAAADWPTVWPVTPAHLPVLLDPGTGTGSRSEGAELQPLHGLLSPAAAGTERAQLVLIGGTNGGLAGPCRMPAGWRKPAMTSSRGFGLYNGDRPRTHAAIPADVVIYSRCLLRGPA